MSEDYIAGRSGKSPQDLRLETQLHAAPRAHSPESGGRQISVPPFRKASQACSSKLAFGVTERKRRKKCRASEKVTGNTEVEKMVGALGGAHKTTVHHIK